MSLGIGISGPEGIVLASDTRLTVNRSNRQYTYDNASKMLVLGDRVAAVTYGSGTVGGRSAHSLIPDFVRSHPSLTGMGVYDYAQALHSFFHSHWVTSGSHPGESQSFILGGISPGEPYGEVYFLNPSASPAPVLEHPAGQFGMRWGGQVEVVSRLVKGIDPSLRASLSQIGGAQESIQNWESQHGLRVPYQLLPLQDGVNLALFLINATISMQGLSTSQRGVGGTIEVVTITPEEGVQWVQRRRIQGERGL